jgi:hypothetical protein
VMRTSLIADVTTAARSALRLSPREAEVLTWQNFASHVPIS